MQMPKLLNRAACVAVIAATALAAPALAQYSGNSAAPLAVWATGTDDVQPKFAPAPNEGHYVSFLSGSGYDVMVARLDKNGNAVWSAPVVVEDRTQSSTTDYGLASDSAGNVYVAYDHPNLATPTIRVKSLDSAGNTRWSQIVTSLSGVNVGRVTVASDGAVWVAHSLNATPRVQRFDAATGTPTFATPITITETGATQIPADIQPSVDGAVIVSCVRYTTFTGAKVLRAHRINVDGTRPWAANGTPVFTTGSLQFGNFPSFIADGAGGAYFCWYATSPLQCYAQRVDASGAVLWGTSGIAVTTTTTDNRVSPSMVLGADNKLYVFWSQQTPNTSIYGIYGQCFAKGARQWGNSGAAVEPMSVVGYSRTWATAGRVGDGVVCFYDDSPSAVQDNIRCKRMSSAGVAEWSADIAVNSGAKYRLTSAPGASNGCVLAWQGGTTTGASDVFAARISADGTLGQPPAGNPADLDGDGSVNASDLATLLSQWGSSGSADLDGDGTVGASDLAILLGSWTA
ncbi:MAG: hypothetical protein RLY21_2250 [Planctomycetota bacterium]|jgi:hypothetical protein